MVAGGTGLTPMYQVFNHILRDAFGDGTKAPSRRLHPFEHLLRGNLPARQPTTDNAEPHSTNLTRCT